MDTQFIEILLLLSKAVPVIAVLWLWLRSVNKERSSNIVKLDAQQKHYEGKIDALQTEFRQSEKESLQILNKLNDTMRKVVENSEDSIKDIMDELKAMSKLLTKKLDELKKEK